MFGWDTVACNNHCIHILVIMCA